MPASLREVAMVSGLTRAQARAAVEHRLVDPDSLDWVDALALRVAVPVRSLVLAGESAGGNVRRTLMPRVRQAVNLTREAAVRDEMDRDTLLLVGRDAAVLRSGVGGFGEAVHAVYADGVLLALPVGQWWNDLRWRSGTVSPLGLRTGS